MIATEDKLSAAVATRLIKKFTHFEIQQTFITNGNTKLRANLKSYFEIGKRQPFLLLTDLDQNTCALELVSNWKKSVNVEAPEHFMFRVAVRAIEAWLLADHAAMTELLKHKKIPEDPDNLENPKRELLHLAKHAPRSVRENLLVKKGVIASQGLGYNAELIDFVYKKWCPLRAATRPESLHRACKSLQRLSS